MFREGTLTEDRHSGGRLTIEPGTTYSGSARRPGPPSICRRGWGSSSGSPCSEHPSHSWQNPILTTDPREVYRALSQAGPGNDINVGSSGSQKAPTWSPASLVTVWVSPTAFEIYVGSASYLADIRASSATALVPLCGSQLGD